MNTEEIKAAFKAADKKTKDIIFAFLVETLDDANRDQLSRFLMLIS